MFLKKINSDFDYSELEYYIYSKTSSFQFELVEKMEKKFKSADWIKYRDLIKKKKMLLEKANNTVKIPKTSNNPSQAKFNQNIQRGLIELKEEIDSINNEKKNFDFTISLLFKNLLLSISLQKYDDNQ